jgi:hypothetical protein
LGLLRLLAAWDTLPRRLRAAILALPAKLLWRLKCT